MTTGGEAQPDGGDGGVAVVADKRGRWPRWIGNTLIALTVLLVLGVAARLSFTAYQIGEATGSLVGGLLILGLLEWALTSKRSARVKGWNRLAVGVLLFFIVANSLGNLVQQQRAGDSAFLQGALDVRREFDQRAQALDARFERLDVDKIVGVDVLADPARHSRARERLAEFRSLGVERTELMRDSLAAMEQYIEQKAPDQTTREQMGRGFQKEKPQFLQLLAETDAAYKALADGYQQALDWAASQAGKLKLRDGKLVVGSADQQGLAALDKQLSAAAARTNEADQRLEAFQAGRQAQFEKLRQRMAPAAR